MALMNNKKKSLYVGEYSIISLKFPFLETLQFVILYGLPKKSPKVSFLETLLLLFPGGLAEEVDEAVVRAAFIPFGDLSDVQLPLDYQTEKHRGFAFVEYELPEDAQAAIDNMVRVNLN